MKALAVIVDLHEVERTVSRDRRTEGRAVAIDAVRQPHRLAPASAAGAIHPPQVAAFAGMIGTAPESIRRPAATRNGSARGEDKVGTVGGHGGFQIAPLSGERCWYRHRPCAVILRDENVVVGAVAAGEVHRSTIGRERGRGFVGRARDDARSQQTGFGLGGLQRLHARQSRDQKQRHRAHRSRLPEPQRFGIDNVTGERAAVADGSPRARSGKRMPGTAIRRPRRTARHRQGADRHWQRDAGRWPG